MATPENALTPRPQPAATQPNSEQQTLGKIRLTVCLMGVIAAVILLLVMGGTTRAQSVRIILMPFLGIQIIAFVTGVFSWRTLFGKCGAVAALAMFLIIVLSMR
jgi:K+-sensing histidine kinase KdpD